MSSDRFILTRRFLSSIMVHWRVFFGMLLCMVLVGALQPLLPWMLAPLLDATVSQKKYPISVQWLPYLILLFIIMLGIFSYGRSYLGGWLDATLQRDYRALMSRQLLRLPLSHLQNDSVGLTTSRFMSFLPQLSSATMPVCMALVQETIKATGYIALMLYWQWQLTLIVLLVAPVAAGMIRIMSKRIKKLAEQMQHESAVGQSRLNEIIATAPAVKMSGESSALQRLNKTFSAIRGKSIRTNIILSAGQPMTHILISIPFSIVVAYILGVLERGDMTAGEAASFLTVMLLLPTPIRVITRAMNTWEQMLVAARQVYGFLDAEPEPDTGTKQLDKAKGDIDFCDVSFSYKNSDASVLNNFSLSIKAGETVALVGRTGAGKTTMCNLLPRFYLPLDGTVKLDGTDINDYTLTSLRQQIAIVTQKPMLFDDTVAMNVAFPDNPAGNDERIKTALQHAAVDDFVNTMPHGIESRIGENGNRLSGGQQQRLMLARAFYRDSPIVILDEATSALDSETEGKIKEAMQRLLVGRTAIIIAHRLSTIDFADRVAVLDQGQMIDVGTVAKLCQTCPLFSEFYRAQQLKLDAKNNSDTTDSIAV